MATGLYVRLDAAFWMDDKVADVSAEAELLYVRSLGHCKQLLSDGFIHTNLLHAICPRFRAGVAPTELADELVRAGLWQEHERGWTVTAWLRHNPSADAVEEQRARDAQRKADWRANQTAERPNGHGVDATRVSQRTKTSRDAQPEPEPEPEPSTTTPNPLHADPSDDHAPGAGGGGAFTADQLDLIDETLERLVDIEQERATAVGRPVMNPHPWRRKVARRLRLDHGPELERHARAGTDPGTAALTIAGWPPGGPTPDDWQALTAARVRWAGTSTSDRPAIPTESTANPMPATHATHERQNATQGVRR
jgi:hypothetical protein